MRFAIIPSNGRFCLKLAIEHVYEQVDRIIVVDTDNAWALLDPDPKIHGLHAEVKLNISHWWNLGLDYVSAVAQQLGDEQWNVAIINDDAMVPPEWFHDVSAWMRENGAAAGCQGPRTLVQYSPVAVPLDQRMQGFAFILAGEKQLRADEGFHWWAGDDDLDWRSREAGGMAMLSGPPVQHLYPNGQVNSELQARIALDMQYFVDKWGRRPW